MNINTRQLNQADLEEVLVWRNHPEVRKYMYTQHEITREEHSNWFDSVSKDKSKVYLIAELEGKPIGLINFTEISEKNKSAFWGFYSGDLSTKGVGRLMEEAALNYAFNNLKLRKLSCEVLSSNPRVIKLHRRYGFSIEGIFKKHFVDSSSEELDIYRLALTKSEWVRTKSLSTHGLTPGICRTFPLTIDEETIKRFAAATGDYNPIHFDDASASKSGFSKRIAHGSILNGFLSKVFGTEFPGAGTIYVSQELSFKKPIYIGATLELTVTVDSVIGDKIFMETIFRGDGSEVLAIGNAVLMKNQ